MNTVIETSKNADITAFSTLRTLAKAEELARPKTIEEVQNLFQYIKSENKIWNILGGGSNSLLSSRSIPGITVCMTALDFLKKLDDNTVEVGAGMRMPRFCALMARESLTGAEFMEGIPGTIGGGIVMNAGAHGSEMANILVSAKVLDLNTLELIEFKKEDLNFSYRNSIIKPDLYLLVSATFKLEQADKDEIRERIVTYNKLRTSHQPVKAWTCGCTFKNPGPDCRAGHLIDALGLKGMTEGHFQISEKHANFFENHGEGTSQEFCKLVSRVQQIALEKHQVKLEPEVQRIGEFTEEELSIWPH